LTKPPAVEGWDDLDHIADLKIIREFRPGSTTVGVRMRSTTQVTQLYPKNWKGFTFIWNSLDASEVLERKVALDYGWGRNWVEPKWVGYTVFPIKHDGEK